MINITANDDESGVGSYFAQTLLERADRAHIAVISAEVPRVRLSSFLRAVPSSEGIMWSPPDGAVRCATAGVAARIEANGVDRMQVVREGVRALFARVRTFCLDDCKPPPARVLGGVSFHPHTRSTPEPWREFSDASFILPRWTYSHSGDHAYLTLAVDRPERVDLLTIDSILSEIDEFLHVLDSQDDAATSVESVRIARIPATGVTQLSYDAWESHIRQIKKAIQSGALKKVVAARAAEVRLPFRVNDVDLVTRLVAEPSCVRFVFRRAESSFVGASPETLFVKSGTSLRTEALAGTIRSLGSAMPVLSQRSEELRHSHKDQHEHQFVVDEIRRTLGDLTTSIAAERAPEVRKVRNILHLHTPIEATLRPEVTALDLLERLHPTPAIGGTPAHAAADWIAENEYFDRGWYTGAVGWMDTTGDGWFAVAIRCALLTTSRAFIYTGAGVVEESDARAEYAETALKQVPLLRALGVENASTPPTSSSPR